MERRAFLGLLVAHSFLISAGDAQSERLRRIAIVMNYLVDDPIGQARFASIIQSLQALGWTEGRNLTVQASWPGADLGIIQKEINELTKGPWDVVVPTSTPITRVLLKSNIKAPIVFTNVSDPVGDGFVQSLPRPGRNVTGFINYEGPLAGKWLQLLKEIDPRVNNASLLFNPDVAPRHGDYYWNAFESAAKSLGIIPTAAPVRTVDDIDEAIRKISDTPGSGLVVASDSFVGVHRAKIVASAAQHRVTTSYPFIIEGALISYGPPLTQFYSDIAPYIDKILKGAKASDLPVQVPIKVDLVINMRTAKELGLQVPATLLSRADEVIE
ncbi:ABC transporter substrate-binding protein [Bradyrhizobium sp. 62B]|uniref:ABC transporter substrate-binding protein n=1 Tax=Bradyrhizobium sp. 62B TaxID=2898442 RepID=UPI00255818D4|nr:ABC transporter substrate-binding protein [Bradyrhizobium sp. 62B]